ncbi:hypothetical protein D081_1556 [Anaerovibrio sp. JC8]|uniref:hypothetical protein n=1 Tax=Anaerovibrio sp. JC8 TaxID=1240085 RepID=UPI000A0D6AA2|nr:hypothetical protein [Anaerovibrio sp. JC8]ORT99975.1 hypothetical protein D081_1556 [Anaerovibrio sp. JC8]
MKKLMYSNNSNLSLPCCITDDAVLVSGSAAAQDNVLAGCQLQAQMIYNMAIAKEPYITIDMLDIAHKLGTTMVGLENSIKTASSIKKKIDRLTNDALLAGEEPKQDYAYVAEFGDLLRYTELVDHDEMAGKARETVLLLEDKGYTLYEIDNKYLNQQGRYKAVHLNVLSPSGQTFEIQIHSRETMEANQFTHKLYEEWRKPETNAERKAALYSTIKRTYDNLPLPTGIFQLENYKRAI